MGYSSSIPLTAVWRTPIPKTCARRRSLPAQQRIETAGNVELVNIIEATHVTLADENLRHRAATAATDHLRAPLRQLLDVDLFDTGSLARQQSARLMAVGTPGLAVHQHRRTRHIALK